jgi:hypothetical protein
MNLKHDSIGLAAFLVQNGYNYDRISPDEKGDVCFFYNVSVLVHGEIDDCCGYYMRGESKVEPNEFCNLVLEIMKEIELAAKIDKETATQ